MGQKRKRRDRRRGGAPGGGAAASDHGPRGPAKVVVAPRVGPPWLRPVLTVLAGVYLVSLFLNGAGSSLPRRLLPRTALYLVQTTCLFPHAARMAIDYRLEGWRCDAGRFEELDVRPHFPVHADDKESRFQRVGFFHRRNRPVMQALERYVLERENALQPGRAIGGIRLSSLRIPLPEPGEPVDRWSRRPLGAHPAEQIKHWYYTPRSKRPAQCAAAGVEGSGPW
jgi:hypothetical protein